jgi:hypothetical protein
VYIEAGRAIYSAEGDSTDTIRACLVSASAISRFDSEREPQQRGIAPDRNV